MDARPLKFALLLSVFASMGATFRTPNFVVNAPDSNTAKQVAQTAERCREELAVEWLGKTLPRWAKPCQVTVHVGQVGAGGATSFAFDRGEVFGWKMKVQGTLERILDSVIPHEVSHTVFACYFRRPLPRWADEGAATLVEHESERKRQHLTLKQVFNTSRRIPLKKLLTITEYPTDMQDVLTLYAQGYSLADFLVQLGGKKRYLEFLNDAHKKNWDYALKKHYTFDNVSTLEQQWAYWVGEGSPALLPPGQMLADGETSQPKSSVVFRSQAPEGDQDSSLADQPNGGQRQDDERAAPDMQTSANEAKASKRNRRLMSPRIKVPEGNASTGDSQEQSNGASQPANDLADSHRQDRLPRPKSLVLRQTFTQDESERSTDNTTDKPPVKKTRDRALGLPLDSGDDLELQVHPAEEQELSSSRHPDWSDFPRHRTRDGSTRLENASGMSDSP